MTESLEEDELIIRSINQQIQSLTDAQEDIQKAIKQLEEGLQALKDYHSREIIMGVLDKVNPF